MAQVFDKKINQIIKYCTTRMRDIGFLHQQLTYDLHLLCFSLYSIEDGYKQFWTAI